MEMALVPSVRREMAEGRCIKFSNRMDPSGSLEQVARLRLLTGTVEINGSHSSSKLSRQRGDTVKKDKDTKQQNFTAACKPA